MAVDPDAYESVAPDVHALIDAWYDRGVSSRAAWSIFLTSLVDLTVLSGISRESLDEAVDRIWKLREPRVRAFMAKDASK